MKTHEIKTNHLSRLQSLHLKCLFLQDIENNDVLDDNFL